MVRDLERLIDGVFAGVLEDPPWFAFLEALEDALPSHNTTLVMRKPRAGDPGILLSPRGNIRGMSVLQERLFAKSPFLDLPEGEVCLFHEMLTPQNRAQHADYLDYLQTFSTSDLIGLNLVDPQSGITFRLRAGRNCGEPDFGDDERQLLRALIPRLRIAVAIFGRLTAQNNQLQVLRESSERLSIGSLMLSESGEILNQNTVFERALNQRDGVYMERGRLRCCDRDDERTLYEALAALSKSEGDRALKIRRDDSRHWNMLLRAAGPNVALGENVARATMVFIRGASAVPEVSANMLGELFGLTPAEAAVAVRLVQGQSVDEAAAALGVSRYTARAQLAAIFAKTNTHRQPQLVSLILGTINTLWN